MSGGDVTCRTADIADVPAIAALFAACKPHSVWAQIDGAVTHLYFEHYCVVRTSLAIVATLNGEVVGACMGTSEPESDRRRFYTRNAFRLCAAFTREVAKNPSVALVVVGRVIRGGWRLTQSPLRIRRRRAEEPRRHSFLAPGARSAYMALFFVAPAARGRSLGAAMLQRFGEIMTEKGCSWCWTRVSNGNVASQIAHERAGFSCVECRDDGMIFALKLRDD